MRGSTSGLGRQFFKLVRYYNLQGFESPTVYAGINIYADVVFNGLAYETSTLGVTVRARPSAQLV